MDWVPIVVAVVAAIASLSAQQLIARGEPAALKRLVLLGQAIDSMPEGDEGRLRLEATRSILAKRLGITLLGLTGFARALWVIGWTGITFGTIWFVIWMAYLLLQPASTPDNIGTISVLLLGTSPLLLVYARVWPGIERGLDGLLEIVRQRTRSKRTAGTSAG